MRLIIAFCFVVIGQTVLLRNAITEEGSFVSVGLDPTIATLIQTLTTHAITAFNLSANVSIQFKYDGRHEPQLISELLGDKNSEATTCHDLGIETDHNGAFRFLAQNKKPYEIRIDGNWVYAPPHNDIVLYNYNNLRISFDLKIVYNYNLQHCHQRNPYLFNRYSEVLLIESEATNIRITTNWYKLQVSLTTNVTGQQISVQFPIDYSEYFVLKRRHAWNKVSIEFQNNSKMIWTLNGMQTVFEHDFIKIFNPINQCHRLYIGFRQSYDIEMAKYGFSHARTDVYCWDPPHFWDEDNGGIQPIKLRNLTIGSLATSANMVNCNDTLKLARKYESRKRLKKCTIL